MRYWTIKTFRSKDNMQKWIDTKSHLYQWREVFINNGWAVECRRLIRVY